MSDDKGTEGLPNSGQTGPSNNPPPDDGLRPGDSPEADGLFPPRSDDAPWDGLVPTESQSNHWFDETFPTEKKFKEWQEKLGPYKGPVDLETWKFADWKKTEAYIKLAFIGAFADERGEDPFDIWPARERENSNRRSEKDDREEPDNHPEEEPSGWVDDDSYQTTVLMPDGTTDAIKKGKDGSAEVIIGKGDNEKRYTIEDIERVETKPPPKPKRNLTKPIIIAIPLVLATTAGVFALTRGDDSDSTPQEDSVEVQTEEVESAVEVNEPVAIEADETESVEPVESVEIDSEEPIVLVEDQTADVDQREGIEGRDEVGDASSSRNVSVVDNPAAMAVDIVRIGHESPDAATNVFTIDLAGDGEGFATDSGNLFYQIAVFVDGELPWPESGWGANVDYRDGVLIAGDGPSLWSLDDSGLPMATSLRPASVLGEWEQANRFVVTVFSPDELLEVDGFEVASANQIFGDSAVSNSP